MDEADDSRIEALESHVAHLQNMLDELSDVMARQETELALMARRVHLLLEREAERAGAGDGGGGGAVLLGDEKPPHW